MLKFINMRIAIIFFSIIFILISSLIYAGQAPKQFSFQKRSALDEWEEKIFKGKVLYTVQDERKDGYLKAYSHNAASGIFYQLNVDPKTEPMISWKWKVVTFPKKKTAAQEGGWIEKDDYAARLYVIFPKLSFTLTKSIEYVWDKSLPKGTIMTSPYFKNIKIIVVESGDKGMGKWIAEERNIYEDYKKAFGREPGIIGAIAIMTDTDNTLSTAEAHYDELRVGYKNESR